MGRLLRAPMGGRMGSRAGEARCVKLAFLQCLFCSLEVLSEMERRAPALGLLGLPRGILASPLEAFLYDEYRLCLPNLCPIWLKNSAEARLRPRSLYILASKYRRYFMLGRRYAVKGLDTWHAACPRREREVIFPLLKSKPGMKRKSLCGLRVRVQCCEKARLPKRLTRPRPFLQLPATS